MMEYEKERRRSRYNFLVLIQQLAEHQPSHEGTVEIIY